MSNDYKISIIIPAHNSEDTIVACLDSIINQKYKNVEVLVVENGSTDNTFEILEEYSKKHQEIIAIKAEKKGVSNARNIGLKRATGDIIGFCDSDDYMDNNSLEIVNNEFSVNESLICLICGFNTVIPSNNMTIIPHYIDDKLISRKKALELIVCDNRVMGMVCNKFFKSSALNNHSFDISLSYCEDMHFNVSVLNDLCSGDIRLIKAPLYNYVVNVNSVTNNVYNFFDDDNNLKYIVSMNKMLEISNLDKNIKDLINAKIALFSVDYTYKMDILPERRQKLIHELKKNYRYLAANFYKFDCIESIKRLVKGIILLVQNQE